MMQPISRLWQAPKAGRAVRLGRAAPEETAAPEPGWQEGFDEGLAAGAELTEERFAQDRAALAKLAATLEALAVPSRNVLAAMIAETTARLVAQVAGAAAVDAGLLRQRASAAADALIDEAGSVTMRLHPDDIAMLSDTHFSVPLLADPTLPRGSVRAETCDAWAADGVTEALARVHAVLGL